VAPRQRLCEVSLCIRCFGDGYAEQASVYLADGGIHRTKGYIDDLSFSGDVLFIDDAHHLLSHSGGRKVMDDMMQEMEAKRGKFFSCTQAAKMACAKSSATALEPPLPFHTCSLLRITPHCHYRRLRE
jgi:hypothetical protein